jgi:enamine deaminase RidA (YjgF/YER057c/UK114 family)
MRTRIAGASPYEPLIGFSRALRAGNAVYVSGTGPVGMPPDQNPADAAAQARHVLGTIEGVLVQAGLKREHVVRTRIYLTDAADWEAVGRVHGEFFGAIRPAATMVVVAGLLNPMWRVEIEADAVILDAELEAGS